MLSVVSPQPPPRPARRPAPPLRGPAATLLRGLCFARFVPGGSGTGLVAAFLAPASRPPGPPAFTWVALVSLRSVASPAMPGSIEAGSYRSAVRARLEGASFVATLRAWVSPGVSPWLFLTLSCRAASCRARGLALRGRAWGAGSRFIGRRLSRVRRRLARSLRTAPKARNSPARPWARRAGAASRPAPAAPRRSQSHPPCRRAPVTVCRCDPFRFPERDLPQR